MTENEGVGASMGSQSEDRREQGKVAEGSLARLAKGPAAKYVGFALLLAWHYALWFVPHVFVQTELLDERVTVSWLLNLGATVLFLFLIALLLGRKRHLSSYILGSHGRRLRSPRRPPSRCAWHPSRSQHPAWPMRCRSSWAPRRP